MVNRRGVGTPGCLVYTVLLAFTGYFAWPTAEAYLDFYRYRDKMEQEARFAVRRTDQQIQSRLRSYADSLDLPPRARFIRIQRGTRFMRISASYDHEVRIPFLGTREITFNPLVEKTF